MEYKNINNMVVENIMSLFDEKRIVCLLRYGPRTKFDGTPPLDFDFLLLLDEYQNNDYLMLSHFKKLGLPVEIFIDYRDQIVSKGIENYQRGRHGSYFFKILASADTLLGKNFYRENENQLDKNKINLDLLYRIEEYFYRIQKSIVNEEIPSKKEIEKYLGRILTDLLLIVGDINFQDTHKYHYTHIIFDIVNTTDIVDVKTKNLISRFLSKSNLDLSILGKIINVLYKKYLKTKTESSNMINANSSQYKNLFFTYIFSGGFSEGAIILLDGLPSNPSHKEELMKKLIQKNYDVFFPRYEGTWESKGEFLKKIPSKTIIEFINALRKGLKIGDRKYDATKIFILGASFGGGVALDIANQNIADKICVTSPVISFRKVQGIDTLENFLKTTHKNNYRFDSKNWQKLLNDRIWDLENNKIKRPSDILIISGSGDNQIKDADIIDFGKKHGVKVHSCELGHITLSKITEPILKEIIDFFSK